MQRVPGRRRSTGKGSALGLPSIHLALEDAGNREFGQRGRQVPDGILIFFIKCPVTIENPLFTQAGVFHQSRCSCTRQYVQHIMAANRDR